MTNPQHSAISPVKVALTCVCPRCGKGPLFTQLLTLREKCASCGLDYKFIDTGDGPAVFAIFILGFLMLGGALIAHFSYGMPLWLVYTSFAVLTPLVAIGLLRYLKAILIALQYKHRAEEGRLAKD
jgi:uncharacterized protein (DUF983 family)